MTALTGLIVSALQTVKCLRADGREGSADQMKSAVIAVIDELVRAAMDSADLPVIPFDEDCIQTVE